MSEIKINFIPAESPPGWDRGWPKMVTGICKSCQQEGKEFQVSDYGYIMCGSCKVKLGEEMIAGMLKILDREK